MSRFALLALAVASTPHLAPSGASGTSEVARSGASFHIGRSGSTWIYAAEKGRATLTVDRMENWASHFHFEWGKRSVSGTWRVRDGAWVEKLAGREETVVLPAKVSVGARWSGPSSFERAESGLAQFEVLSLDSQVELPDGSRKDGCVAVLETGGDGSRPFTHYYAPNVGKVGVQGPDGWLLRLVEFRAGRGSGGD